MKGFKRILVFLISICFYSCAEFQYSARRQSQAYSIQNCKEIYGKWISYSEWVDLENWRQKHQPEIWIFNEDGTLVVDGAIQYFKIKDDCSKLIIGTDSNSFVITKTKDTLHLFKDRCIVKGTIVLA